MRDVFGINSGKKCCLLDCRDSSVQIQVTVTVGSAQTHRDAREGDTPDAVAVVRVVPGDDVDPLWLSDLDVILTCELDGRLVGLGARREEDGVGEAPGSVSDELGGQSLGGGVCESRGVVVGQLGELFCDRRDDSLIAMTYGCDRCASASVEDPAAISSSSICRAKALAQSGDSLSTIVKPQIGALGAHHLLRRSPVQRPVQEVGSGLVVDSAGRHGGLGSEC
jgi:hypothetical protein